MEIATRIQGIKKMAKMKICTKCHKEKPVTEFHQNSYVRKKDGIKGRNPVCKQCANKRRMEYHQSHREQSLRNLRKYFLKVKYGMTEQDWQNLFEKQKGCCVICGRHQSVIKRRLYVDHDHTTQVVRGLLCRQCNVLLGWYENHKEIIDLYLKNGN